MRTQLSLIPDLVPEKVLRVRTAAPRAAHAAAVQAVLVALAPRLPAQSLPTVHADCVEIPVLKSTELEGTLRDAGFTWHTTPRDEAAPPRGPEWRFWRLIFATAVTP